jgi:hypothetical protein
LRRVQSTTKAGRGTEPEEANVEPLNLEPLNLELRKTERLNAERPGVGALETRNFERLDLAISNREGSEASAAWRRAERLDLGRKNEAWRLVGGRAFS